MKCFITSNKLKNTYRQSGRNHLFLSLVSFTNSRCTCHLEDYFFPKPALAVYSVQS